MYNPKKCYLVLLSEVVVIGIVAAALHFLNGLVERGDERLGRLGIPIDFGVPSIATLEGVAEDFDELFDGSGVGRIGASTGLDDGVGFHFVSP